MTNMRKLQRQAAELDERIERLARREKQLRQRLQYELTKVRLQMRELRRAKVAVSSEGRRLIPYAGFDESARR